MPYYVDIYAHIYAESATLFNFVFTKRKWLYVFACF